jgi:transcriptional regulator with XRE-family HTH domain
MIIAERIRQLRKQHNLSQGDLETRTGLFRSYISRVENGHTIPDVETLERFANALEVPLYRLFYDGVNPPKFTARNGNRTVGKRLFGVTGKQAIYLRRFTNVLARIKQKDEKLLLAVAKNGGCQRIVRHQFATQ